MADAKQMAAFWNANVLGFEGWRGPALSDAGLAARLVELRTPPRGGSEEAVYAGYLSARAAAERADFVPPPGTAVIEGPADG